MRADAVVADLAEDRPAIDPRYGQQAGGASFPGAVAVVGEEIPVAFLRLHDAALVGLVEVGLRVAELPFFGVGAGDAFRALHHDVAAVAAGLHCRSDSRCRRL